MSTQPSISGHLTNSDQIKRYYINVVPGDLELRLELSVPVDSQSRFHSDLRKRAEDYFVLWINDPTEKGENLGNAIFLPTTKGKFERTLVLRATARKPILLGMKFKGTGRYELRVWNSPKP